MKKEAVEVFSVGERLDKALAIAMPEYSRATLEKMVNLGLVWVNSENKDTRYRIKPGDKVEIDLSKLKKVTPEIEIPVIYEDDNVVVINKPVGLLAHSKGTFNNEATVATWLRHHSTGSLPAKADEFWSSNRAGIVHRLDRATSGIMICAKNAETQTHLQKQFANRNVKKAYVAVVEGELPENEGLIDVPIERNPKKPATFRAGPNGKSAQTEFQVLNTSRHRSKPDLESKQKFNANGTQIKSDSRLRGNDVAYSLVELKPHTGRTHQLRVHLNYLKHPIVGDEFYNGKPANRLMLHAKSLELTLPGGIRKTFEASVPSELLEMM